ncbi:hypothetical protein AAVH_11233 [Aphelenchoides avenae]|nr:hypothetical protein AAVH_11233 [Aphelenchus avenae]
MTSTPALSPEGEYYVFLESVLEDSLKVICSIYIPVVALVAWIVHWNTPAEMQSFRLTMTNGAVWMVTNIVYWSLLFRPMPLSPLPIATAKGLLTGVDAIPNQYALYIGLIIAMNFSVAITLCLGTQYMTLTQPLLCRRISRQQGIAIFVCTHVGMSALCALLFWFMALNDVSEEELRAVIEREEPQLASYVKDRFLVGFHPENSLTLITPLTILWFSLNVTAWIYMLVSTIRSVIFKINKGTVEKTQKFRRCVAMVLTLRTFVPLTSTAIPAVVSATLILFEVPRISGFLVTFILVASSNGLLTCVPATLYLKPYREALLKLLCVSRIKKFLRRNAGESSVATTTSSGLTLHGKLSPLKKLNSVNSITASFAASDANL